MVKNLLISILLSCLTCLHCHGQEDIMKSIAPEVDTNYVDLLYDSWSIRSVATFKYQNLILRNDNGDIIRFIPKDRTAVGLGFAYKFLAVDVALRLLLARDNFTKRFDFQGDIALQKHLVDINVQRYEGFEKRGKTLTTFREDVRSWVIGLNYFYNFNHRKLSIRSVFTGNRRQKKSAGSFVLGGFISVQDLESDSTLSAGETGFDSGLIRNARFNLTGIQGGYTYLKTLPANFYLFGGIMPGMGLNNGFTRDANQNDINMEPMFKLSVNAAAGHIGKRFYGGVIYSADYFLLNIENRNNLDYNIGKIKFVIGYKLNQPVKFIDQVTEN